MASRIFKKIYGFDGSHLVIYKDYNVYPIRNCGCTDNLKFNIDGVSKFRVQCIVYSCFCPVFFHCIFYL